MPLAFWKRSHSKPAGALPRNFLTKLILLLVGPFILAIFLFDFFSADETSTPVQDTPAANQQPADHNSYENAKDQLAGEARRMRAERARNELLQQQQQRTEQHRLQQQSLTSPGQEALTDHGGDPLTEEEWKLQQALRLEDIERRRRSLRSDPLVKTARGAPLSATDPTPAAQVTAQNDSPKPQPAKDEYLDNLTATLSLFSQAETGSPQPDSEIVSPSPAPEPSPITANKEAAYTSPQLVSTPQDPEGWERVYEGSFIEAVLVTQLAGDFPGPVLAQVSVPFYSRDRQHTLIPRGARLIGTAQQVSNRDQARLSVAFHRLIFPDGRWVTLPFLGLNQLGETGLKDRVNRHYLSLFAATGAIGILSGLTLQGSDPYRGGLSGFRSGAGQGFGQGASRIMERFLNRFPSITIRAGHRLRIWFTSDLLLPTGNQV